MLSLHTNAAALSTQGSLGSTQKALSTSMTRLGTGFRVNSQTRGMAVAQRNTQNGISMLQTAEGALNEVTNIVLRMKDLATEAANRTATTEDKTAAQAQFKALNAEIKNIMDNTKFGGKTLFASGGTLS